jgi:hypothetical protein
MVESVRSTACVKEACARMVSEDRLLDPKTIFTHVERQITIARLQPSAVWSANPSCRNTDKPLLSFREKRLSKASVLLQLGRVAVSQARRSA